jgi:preprotein translocase SecE subunit
MSSEPGKPGNVPEKGLKPATGKDQPKAARKPEPKRSEEAESHTIIDTMKDYFRSLKFEWLKLTFPNRKELIQSTIVVFLFTIILMVIISLYDMLMSVIFSRFILPAA